MRRLWVRYQPAVRGVDRGSGGDDQGAVPGDTGQLGGGVLYPLSIIAQEWKLIQQFEMSLKKNTSLPYL